MVGSALGLADLGATLGSGCQERGATGGVHPHWGWWGLEPTGKA